MPKMARKPKNGTTAKIGTSATNGTKAGHGTTAGNNTNTRNSKKCQKWHNCRTWPECRKANKPETARTPAMARKPGAARTPETGKNAQNSTNARNSTNAKHNTKPGMAQKGDLKKHEILTKFKPNSILKDDCRPVAGVVFSRRRAGALRRITPQRPPKPAAIASTFAQFGALAFFYGAAAVTATIIGDFKLWFFYNNMQMRLTNNQTVF